MAGSSSRLVALDAFRGLTIAFMVLVNDAGDGRHSYWPLDHAQWNGWTPTDVVFPTFVWIVGVAITLSLSKRLAAGASRAVLMRQAFRRALILYVLGLIVYAAPAFDLGTQRLLGVLQRIAICYLAAALIYLTTKLRGQIIWLMGLLAVYWLLMAFAPVPGFGAGRLDVEGNFAHYVDRIVLGAHNYHNTKTWDPEGVVSTLPAIGTALLGVMAGHILRLDVPLAVRRHRLLLVGVFLVALGMIWDLKLPINKKLWTDSFATFMAGLDFAVLAILIWFVDERGWSKWVKPFLITGMNAITVYLASEFLSEFLDAYGFHKRLYERFFAAIASPMNASLLWALSFVALMYLLAWFLYRRRWFLRV